MIQSCRSSIVEATPILLTSEEHAELESLARSTNAEHRARVKDQVQSPSKKYLKPCFTD